MKSIINKKNIIILIVLILSIIGIKVSINKYNLYKTKQVISELDNIFSNEVITPEKDIISEQKETDIKIKQAMSSNNYTLDSPFILVNPYHISPLSAIIIFKSSNGSEVSVNINGYETVMEKAKTYSIPIYGLIAETKNVVTLKQGKKTKEITIDLSKTKNDLNSNVLKESTLKNNNEFYIVTTPLEKGSFGFNNKGELNWRLTPGYSLAITRLKNGNLLLGSDEYSMLSISRKGLVEIDYLGKIHKIYDIDGGYNSDVIELENGNFLLGTSSIRTGTNYDVIIEIDRNTAQIVNEYNLKDIINNISEKFVESIESEIWGFLNSIYYDKDTKSLILSLEGRNSIISLDYNSKKINWIFGDIKYWNEDFRDYIVEYDGVYPHGAHTASLDKKGHLTLFNNNYDGTTYDDAPCFEYKDHNSSVQVFKIENKNASLINSFDDDKTFYSYAVSSFTNLKNGYLINSAWQFQEETYLEPQCTMNSVEQGINSTIYEINENNEILFKINLPFGSYRANKLNMYEKTTKNFVPTTVETFNTIVNDIKKEISLRAIKDDLKNAPISEFSYEVSENLLSINAMLQLQDDLSVILVGKDGSAYEYFVKQKGYYLQPVVSLKDLTGEFAFFLKINNEYSNLNAVYLLDN